MSTFTQESAQPLRRRHYAEFDDSSFQIRGRTLFFIVVLFSVVLLVVLLFLYVRWVCRFDPPPPLPTSTSGAASAHSPPRGLDRAAIKSVPILLYKESASEGGVECCICLGIIGDGEKVKVLPQCRHCFHSECVDMWLTTQSSCPLCRASLQVDSPV